ncbi:MAG: hypothetical protein ACRDYX_09690 [Egibacteraceae bacterium]
MDWIVEFFRTLPSVVKAAWEFGSGGLGFGVTVGSIVLTALFLHWAHRLRERYGWLSALCGTMAATIAAFWAFGILPSAWVYFADGQKDLMADQVIPTQISIGSWVIASNFYQVARDSVVVVETIVAMAAFAVLGLRVQKRHPRSLAEGEEPRPQSGGYK